MKTQTITIKEYLRKKAFGILDGAVESDVSPIIRAEQFTFVNNPDEIARLKLEEYNAWYAGDGDGLLNFYTRANMIDYNYDPLYQRNKRSYFYAISSSEGDIKRTHSGQPRNIVDTLSGIVGEPNDTVADNDRANARLEEILEENNFADTLTQEARPLTLVEGWGAWKINWDLDVSDTPIILYYRADAVDFVYRNKRLVAIIYKDYYTDENNKKYILFETRRLARRDVTDPNTGIRAKVMCLVIEKDLFKLFTDQTDNMAKVPLNSLPELADVEERIVVENFSEFLGAPNIYYKDSTDLLPGRSIYTGKIDLFDDLDQCLSQSSNTVRRSTPVEYFDEQYLERDEFSGLPKQPKVYDRKYITYKGILGGDGQITHEPITVTQPRLDFSQYSSGAIDIMLQIINGIMSPATLGIDIAKKDNASAQREKEKVTIFTRNGLIKTEKKTVRSLCKQLLMADELMHEGRITKKDYAVDVKYDEFADASFEAKLNTVLTGWQGGLLSDDMAIEYLHRGSPESVKQRELEFIKKQREEEKELAGRNQADEQLAALGEELGGENEEGSLENFMNDEEE